MDAIVTTAIATLIIGIKANRINLKIFQISKKEHEYKKPNFSAYLIKANRLRIGKNREELVLLFDITISNKSDMPDTFQALVEVDFLFEDETHFRYLLHHDPGLHSLTPLSKNEVFSKHIRIEARGGESGWLLFRLSSDMYKDVNRIDNYRLVVRSVANIETFVDASLTFDYNEER